MKQNYYYYIALYTSIYMGEGQSSSDANATYDIIMYLYEVICNFHVSKRIMINSLHFMLAEIDRFSSRFIAYLLGRLSLHFATIFLIQLQNNFKVTRGKMLGK